MAGGQLVAGTYHNAEACMRGAVGCEESRPRHLGEGSGKKNANGLTSTDRLTRTPSSWEGSQVATLVERLFRLISGWFGCLSRAGSIGLLGQAVFFFIQSILPTERDWSAMERRTSLNEKT